MQEIDIEYDLDTNLLSLQSRVFEIELNQELEP